MSASRNGGRSLALLGLLALATLLLAPLLGSIRIGWDDVMSGPGGESTAAQVFWRLRVPRVAMAALAGASLAAAGCVFQSIFRNPLAEPFTLGVASGASLGAAIGLHMGWTGLLFGFLPVMTGLAFVGAATSIMVVWTIARVRGAGSANTLLLAGVAIGFVSAAMILLLEFLSSRPVTNEIVRWLMGSVDRTGAAGLFETIPFAAAGAAVVWYLHKSLDLLMMGELVASSRGVSVKRTRAAAYFAASLVTAAVVAQCGPIAFVGLLVPHLTRALVGPVHRRLLPAAALAGAAFLPWCDVVAANLLRWLHGSALQIPVGVITNLLGGLFFIYLLFRRPAEAIVVDG